MSDQENEEGHGIVSGPEPSTEELEQRFKEQHAEHQHGGTEGQPDPKTGSR
jgi:hypothetical protein